MSFSFETTLAGRSYLHTITQLNKRGFTVHIFYLWVNNVDVALSRISDRVKKGGHQIPEDVVRRRFDRSFQNFMGEYVPLVDSWYVFDNSESVPSLLAFKRAGKIHIIKSDRYSHLVRSFEKL